MVANYSASLKAKEQKIINYYRKLHEISGKALTRSKPVKRTRKNVKNLYGGDSEIKEIKENNDTTISEQPKLQNNTSLTKKNMTTLTGGSIKDNFVVWD
jgi:hypothetical protein